ncbi:MAG: diaminopimelate decarboxylase [Saprospiraceae bacterium]|nr:diaminopimelate decarboxylase [Saprospiraceae bacterium]
MQKELDSLLLTNAAHEFGTPLYIYDSDSIRMQYLKLITAFKGIKSRIFYACKALTNIHILKLMNELDSNIDCSSINEIHLAMLAGFSPEKIIFTSNGVLFDEVIEAVGLGVHVNIDNISTLERFGMTFGGKYPASIRLRPNIMAGGNINIATGHENSKFGIPIEMIDSILTIVEKYNIEIDGLHIHSGSDMNDQHVYVKEVEIMADYARFFPHLNWIDLGGGLKIPYDQHENETDINQLALRLAALFKKFRKPDGSEYEIWLEPGKFLVSACGYLVSRVNVIQKTPKQTFVYLDTGFNHLIRPMFYGAFHRITNLSNEGGLKQPYNIVGNLCETDTFAENRSLPEISEGDYLVFHNAGAYGFEMSMNYNARLKPAEVMVENGNTRLIRRRDNLKDLLRNQIDTENMFS